MSPWDTVSGLFGFIESLGLHLAPVTMTTSSEQRGPVALTFNPGASVMPKHEASGEAHVQEGHGGATLEQGGVEARGGMFSLFLPQVDRSVMY